MPKKPKPDRVDQLLAQYKEHQRALKAGAMVEGAILALVEAVPCIPNTAELRGLRADLRGIVVALRGHRARLETLAGDLRPR